MGVVEARTGGLRIGFSARSVKKTLAEFGGVDLQDVEKLWHAIDPPYTELFQWLEGKGQNQTFVERSPLHL